MDADGQVVVGGLRETKERRGGYTRGGYKRRGGVETRMKDGDKAKEAKRRREETKEKRK